MNPAKQEKKLRDKRFPRQIRNGKTHRDFKGYLESIRLRPSTIVNHLRYTQRFLQWLETENLTLENCTYNDLLNIIKAYRQQGFSVNNINNHLNGIRYWYDYQRKQGTAGHNPAVNLRIRGSIEQLPNNLLTPGQVEQVYGQYQAETPVQKRNKMMIGLVVYQGLEREELQRLEPGDINLVKGLVRARRNSRLQGRTLKLHACQILPLQEYLTNVRSELLKRKGQPSEKLFVTIGESQHIKEAMRELLNGLKKKYPFLKSFLQIRISVISHWVKEKNIREVQYMAGHASIYSTQRYIRASLDDLKEELSLFHPLQ
jgi:integrase/recombinase XerD